MARRGLPPLVTPLSLTDVVGAPLTDEPPTVRVFRPSVLLHPALGFAAPPLPAPPAAAPPPPTAAPPAPPAEPPAPPDCDVFPPAAGDPPDPPAPPVDDWPPEALPPTAVLPPMAVLPPGAEAPPVPVLVVPPEALDLPPE